MRSPQGSSSRKVHGLECALGGGVSARLLDFMRWLPDGSLDRYETRKVVFGCPAGLGEDAEKGILKAVGFRAHVAQEQARLLRPDLRGGPRAHRDAPGPVRPLIEQAGGLYG